MPQCRSPECRKVLLRQFRAERSSVGPSFCQSTVFLHPFCRGYFHAPDPVPRGSDETSFRAVLWHFMLAELRQFMPLQRDDVPQNSISSVASAVPDMVRLF
jgi:hypothetical protein